MGKEKMTREDGMETIGLDDELAADYLSECREHLATVGRGLWPWKTAERRSTRNW